MEVSAVAVTHKKIICERTRCIAYFRLTFLRMRDKCKIINVQRHDKAFMV